MKNKPLLEHVTIALSIPPALRWLKLEQIFMLLPLPKKLDSLTSVWKKIPLGLLKPYPYAHFSLRTHIGNINAKIGEFAWCSKHVIFHMLDVKPTWKPTHASQASPCSLSKYELGQGMFECIREVL